MNIAGLHCCMCLCKKFHLSANELGIGGGGWGWGVYCYQVCTDTSLSDLIVIFSIHFFNYAFKRKLILQDMKKASGKHHTNTIQSNKSRLFFSSLPFLPLPSTLLVVEIIKQIKHKDMLCSFTLRMGMNI